MNLLKCYINFFVCFLFVVIKLYLYLCNRVFSFVVFIGRVVGNGRAHW